MATEEADFREVIDHQMLDAMGVPPEQHEGHFALQREIRKLRAQEREAVRRNHAAMATVVGRMLGLPEGCTFELK